MFGWLRELFEIRYDFRERRQRLAQQTLLEAQVCQSCEVLKMALERSNYEKEKLLNEVLRKEEPKPDEPPSDKIEAVKPRQTSFAIKRQQLEAEDRAKADVIRRFNEASKIAAATSKRNPAPTNAPIESNSPSIEDIEKELGINK